QLNDPPVMIFADPGAVRTNAPNQCITVILAGVPQLASDANFNESTSVSRVHPDRLPFVIANLYESVGIDCVARLEGDFALIIIDRRITRVMLVTDKFGIRDIYVRETHEGLCFASDLHLLSSEDVRLDGLSVAFYIAQEGFFPAPYTLLEGVRTLGRAAILEVNTSDGVHAEQRRYWRPSSAWSIGAVGDPLRSFPKLLNDTLDLVPGDSAFGLLLSGGVDSSLLAAAASRSGKRFIALTGTVRGYTAGEREILNARHVAEALGVRHRSVILDPDSSDLPERWRESAQAWTVGTRVSFPLWLEFGRELSGEIGPGFSVVTGQMADTVADNNYTNSSNGYRLRRMFYSPGFFQALPILGLLTPGPNSTVGRLSAAAVARAAGAQVGEQFRSLLGGMQTRQAWLEGRLFGFGEFPGRSAAAFPILRPESVDRVAEWYSNAFLCPLLEGLDTKNFYARLFEMSLNMCMLHLDTRVVFRAASMMGGQAFMPFLTARMVNYFMSLPYSARSLLKPPKWVIAETRRRYLPSVGITTPPNDDYNDKSVETLLLDGSLGEYFRQILAAPSFPSLGPAVMTLLREDYLEEQLRRLKRRSEGTDARLIIRLAALETWSRSLSTTQPHTLCSRHT
ncbi:MAG: asparagine synthase-related protein, partial [Bryobacteraceae bacterium]